MSREYCASAGRPFSACKAKSITARYRLSSICLHVRQTARQFTSLNFYLVTCLHCRSQWLFASSCAFPTLCRSESRSPSVVRACVRSCPTTLLQFRQVLLSFLPFCPSVWASLRSARLFAGPVVCSLSIRNSVSVRIVPYLLSVASDPHLCL